MPERKNLSNQFIVAELRTVTNLPELDVRITPVTYPLRPELGGYVAVFLSYCCRHAKQLNGRTRETALDTKRAQMYNHRQRSPTSRLAPAKMRKMRKIEKIY
jgi:hypothetical protein